VHIVWGIRSHDTIAVVLLALVLPSWVTFFGIFVTHERPPHRRSSVGIALPGVGFFFVWAVQRPKFSPVDADPRRDRRRC